jgi:hypothetical protein
MTKPLLAVGTLAIALTGCSFMSDLPGVDRLSSLMTGGNAPELRPVASVTQTAPAPLLGADRGEGALSVVAGEPGWIVDRATNCATSNPFARADEEIRWFGACEDGRLSGRGTLVWYVEGIETERNEGTFRAGEFHGEVITTYPDGEVIVGSYDDGVRDGDFTVIGTTGAHIRATFRRGELVSEEEMTVAQIDAWRNERASSYPGVLLAQAASQPPQVSATSPSANRQVVADAPAASPQEMTRLLASAPAPRPAPSVQLAAVDASERLDQPAQPAQPTIAARPIETAAVTVVPQSAYSGGAYAGRTAHVTHVLGGPVQVAALETRPAPVVRNDAAPVAGAATAPQLTPQTSFAATGTVLIAGDGRAQQLAPTLVAQRTPVRLDAPRAADALRIDRDGAGSLAQQYAGRDGPWVIGGRNDALALNAPSVARIPVAPVAVRALPPTVSTTSAPGTSAPASTATADAVFASAYQLELQGRFADAERMYHDILVAHPSSPTALLANARLESLRQSRGTVQVAQANPPRQNEYVVSANSPAPRYSGLPPTGTAGNPALALESQLINKTVCSQNGLYANDARWCGIVTFDEGQFMRVEVTDITINGFGQIGITRSTCTGNTFLTWFSRGTSVRVPKRCMLVVG